MINSWPFAQYEVIYKPMLCSSVFRYNIYIYIYISRVIQESIQVVYTARMIGMQSCFLDMVVSPLEHSDVANINFVLSSY